MASRRLTLDANLIGYWGLDEALETDTALDETANALDLAVTSSSGAAPGRLGNARKFDGAASFATLSSAALRLTGDLTIVAWVKVLSYSSGGSMLRTILSCGGPTTGDGSLYALYVTANGGLSYRHTAAAGEVIVTTAAATIRTNQFYFIAIRRFANGLNQDVEIYVDNELKTPTTITVNGSPQAMPIPPPAANASAAFSLARSQRQADSAFLDGFLDEVSIHNIARPLHAYLLEAYFRVAIRATTTKLSTTNTVVAVSSAEMGGGVRWWCLERDQDLFVVKESPFGDFGPETALTTVGTPNASQTSRPELIYDLPNDTLYVFFISGNRVYKLTANSSDDPATINMPYTNDTGSIVKSLDNVDAGRVGDGGSQQPVRDTDFTYVNRAPVKFTFEDPSTNKVGDGGSQQVGVTQGTPNPPSIVFETVGGVFGVAVGSFDSETGGYQVFFSEGGATVFHSSTPVMVAPNTGWYSVGTRVFGRRYFARALDVDGKPTDIYTPVIVDFFGTIFETPTNTFYEMGRDGDNSDTATVGDGGSQQYVRDSDFTYVQRNPVKFSFQDTGDVGDGGSQLGSVTVGSTNRPVDAGKVLNL